ncbi:MAG: hypothetical protein ACLP7P_20005 [Rhodomicrobium sp.]
MTKSTKRSLTLTGAIVALTISHSAWADNAEEKQKLAQCAKDICGIIVSKNASGPDLTCDLTKTWEKEEIQKGADAKKIAWGLGTAKCSVKVSAKRADLVAALTSPENTLKISKQSVSCEIGEEKYLISATLAPELTFKAGTSTAASLHIDDIKGATLIKGVVWTAAELEKHFGLLEGDVVREVNRFVQKECPKIAAEAK